MTEELLAKALYIVPTPIGNLQDITARAVAVLKAADVICAEDTRHSMPLLTAIGVTAPKLTSFHDHNEAEKAASIVSLIESGQSVALISDAGTPLISDPGYHLAAACAQSGVKVIPLPGPCAAITALSAAGLPTDRFSFEGFLPVKEKALREKIISVAENPGTVIFYEAPRRIIDTVKIMAEILGTRDLVIARELTKTFETFYRSPAVEMEATLKADPNYEKGEMVVLVAPFRKDAAAQDEVPQEALQLLKLLTKELPGRKAAQIVAQYFGLRKNDVYRATLDSSEAQLDEEK